MQKVLNTFEIGIFPKGKTANSTSCILDSVDHVGHAAKLSYHKQLKPLTPKQMLQRLPIAFAHK